MLPGFIHGSGERLEHTEHGAATSSGCAVTLTWLFSGQRSNEIARLRLGCIRWQHDGDPVAGNSTQILAQDAVCLLDVPAHKTGTAFTKPVDPLLGQAINAWQALRPSQPKRTDKRTGEQVDGSDAGLGDRCGHAARRAGVVMTISNSTGVSRPSEACLRRRW